MRKRLVTPTRQIDQDLDREWLALEEVASVEVTSEDEGYPVEGALSGHGDRGWRASAPGTQIIRLLFDSPQTIRFIRLIFREDHTPRTQEFVLRWRPTNSGDWRDIVRQQWNFSPPHTTEESEEYKVELESAAALELAINPDISRPDARASLQRLQLSVL